ncbi:TPA: hypothetical protein QCX73_003311 [Bacillus mycoides]|nr:hypothetical protein [Bacillus mycoides]HDR7628771.1 hypothetical protein [Bacillus mycoides]
MVTIDPAELVAQLLKNASTRKKRSLEIIHNICKEQYERGSKDFSIPTIGRLSIGAKGPSIQTIRNKEGADYRAVMQCWADYANGTTKKTKTKQENTTSDEILAGITDPTIRALVGVVLAENRKLKSENSLLKQQTKLTIDMRHPTRPLLNTNEDAKVLPQISNLLPLEITALQNAISDEFLKDWGFTTDEQGRIKYKGRTMYKAGYVTAIKKILSNYSKE